MSEQEIENEIQKKGLTAARITPQMIDDNIVNEDYHVFEGSQLTVCCLTLKNGFTVTGESACASPENFDAEIGRKVSREKPVMRYGLWKAICSSRSYTKKLKFIMPRKAISG